MKGRKEGRTEGGKPRRRRGLHRSLLWMEWGGGGKGQINGGRVEANAASRSSSFLSASHTAAPHSARRRRTSQQSETRKLNRDFLVRTPARPRPSNACAFSWKRLSSVDTHTPARGRLRQAHPLALSSGRAHARRDCKLASSGAPVRLNVTSKNGNQIDASDRISLTCRKPQVM